MGLVQASSGNLVRTERVKVGRASYILDVGQREESATDIQRGQRARRGHGEYTWFAARTGPVVRTTTATTAVTHRRAGTRIPRSIPGGKPAFRH